MIDRDLEVNCPFCGERDFDLIGLKYHLENGYCDEYEEIDLLEEMNRKWYEFKQEKREEK